MLQALSLLVPALIPSWRFFKSIEPSPRVEYAWLTSPTGTTPEWQPFAPRPTNLPLRVMALRLLWNPRWNEGLYLVTLAERLTAAPTPHSVAEINRILSSQHIPPRARYLQFRLVFIRRDGTDMVKEVTYISEPHEL